ncbi:B12-binding domain-containing radical SAM protein [Limibacillus halophilus]|uniref:Radical SAM core domain-containing protein n=1 Tax=Limibacillus halophilus TaxID=1579333 RepID=A0A839SQF5_9PROT|nr:radical SAM protein [Limibacillus halophilus]MBB3064064.1 hypothetical protein [Limibacillus halophilus]
MGKNAAAGTGKNHAKKSFRLILVKPSHYDDDGYVIQWLRSAIPSNTLAQLYGLARLCKNEGVLGPDVEVTIDAYDETNRVLPIKRMLRNLAGADGGMLCLVGVQSNQFPRAIDIARPFRDAGLQVGIGGFHVSGCLSMLPELPLDIRQAQEMGISLFAGEAEGRFDLILKDCYAGALNPLYNFMADLPNLEGAVVPFLPADVVAHTAGANTSFDAGRGCPFQCSFCTIINVQGRKSRTRSPDDVEAIVRENLEQGIKRFFITDDNFARNRSWEEIMDRLIHLREEEKLKFSIVIQVDTLCHKTPNFIEKCARAGVKRVFIGLENINPDNLVAAKKRQNKIWEYRKMLQAWKAQGVLTYAGYILGFPEDTPEKIRRDIEIIKHELPVDLLEFFFLTPLPGSEDHKTLYLKQVWMDPDMNKYDLNHRTTHHPSMSDAAWEAIYAEVWESYYALDHVETIMRRAAACRMNVGNLMFLMLWFYGCVSIERLHPLEGGWFRRRVRSQRRHGMPIESALTFWPKRFAQVLHNQASWLLLLYRFGMIRRRIKKDPKARDYMDASLRPVTDEEELETELMQTHIDALPNTYGAPHRKVAAGV